MKTDELIYRLRLLGLTLEVVGGKLNVSPAALLDDDIRHLLRKHRDAIIAELFDDPPRWAWLVRFGTGSAIETYHHPAATHTEVMRKYPDAVSAEPLPECMWPVGLAKEEAA